MTQLPILELSIIEPQRGGVATRSLPLSALPLTIGGPASDLELAQQTDLPAAFLGEVDGELFVQAAGSVLPGDTGEVYLNGHRLLASHWLESGDLLAVQGSTVAFQIEPGGRVAKLTVAEREDGDAAAVLAGNDDETEARLRLTPPSRRSDSPVEERDPDDRFRPRSISRQRRENEGRRLWRPVVVGLGLVLLAVAAWWLLRARSLAIHLTPAAESMAITGPGLHFSLSGRYVLHPGSYQLEATREGYAPLRTSFEVSRDSPPDLDFSFEPLPGLVEIDTAGIAGARVLVDGEEIGTTPFEVIELAGGPHLFEVSSQDHFAWRQEVEVVGLGQRQVVTVELSSRRAELEVSSTPAGASVMIDGRDVGPAPASVPLLSGSHSLELRLPGYVAARRVFEIEPQETLTLGPIVLEEAPALVRIESRPGAALVSLDGVVRGQAPLELALVPGREHALLVSRSGHRIEQRSVRLERGERRDVVFELQPILADVVVRPTPSTAEVVVGGDVVGTGEQELHLAVATPYVVEVRLDGYQPYRTTVTASSSGPVRELDVRLVSLEEVALERAAAAAPKQRITTAGGQELVLVQGGSFETGASRREPGRRANESQRTVELRRSFYFGTREITNREFLAFRSSHRSGMVASQSLEIDDHPVVNVTWQDAAAFCNWLSEKDGLVPVYENGAEGLQARSPLPNGYRLPTESEWVWVARYGAKPGAALKYPWGASLPVADGSGNYADQSAASLLASTIEGYRDGYIATAPVTAFPANSLGVHGLGGNVAEWMHDRYKIYSSASGAVPVVDPVGPDEGELFVIRGAGWRDSGVTQLRLSFRDYGNTARNDLGFRIARYVE
jgi:formylglycine-generating enzyme required for sulfatase activity